MKKPMLLQFAAAALILSSVSCGTLTESDSLVLTASEKKALAAKGKPPQVYGLTAYASPNGVIFAGGFRLHQGKARKLDFVSGRKTTTPVIESDEDQKFLIDTTSTESWLTTRAFKALKGVVLKDTGIFEKNASHVSDDVGGLAIVVPQMIFDEMRIERGVFFMRNQHGPLGMLTRWEKSPVIDGVLGADFIRAFKFVRISLSGRYVVLSTTADYPGNGNIVTTVPIIRSNEGLAIEVAINGNKEPVLVDIAGDFEMATDVAQPDTIRQVSIGDVVYRRVEAVPGRELGFGLEPAPRIGRQLLEKYDLVFNNYGQQLILERPAAK